MVDNILVAHLHTHTSFKYFGCIISVDDNNLPAILSNIRQAHQRWGQISWLLIRDGASSRAMGYFYKAIVQAILLYGSETWVPADRMLKLLNSFHHKCARHIAQDPIRLQPDGTWHTPRSHLVLEQCGLHSMADYIQRRKDTITSFV